MLGNNFFTLGKNSKFWEKRKKIIMKKKQKNNNNTKIICREGFVEIFHFEGGRILPSVGKGRVAFWGEAEPGDGCTLSM